MRALLVIPIVLALALLAPMASAQQIPRPTWSAGDAWELHQPDGSRLTFRVEAEDILTDGARNVTAYRVDAVLRTPNGTSAQTSTVWYRTSDLARLREALLEHGETRTRSYDHGCVETPFPLREGASWNVSCEGEILQTGQRFTLRYDASVRGVGTVDVPVGSFATMLVVRNLTSGEVREHWSSDACHWVRKESAQGVVALGAFRCRATDTSATAPTVAPAPSSPRADVPAPAAPLVLMALAALALLARRSAR